MELSDFILIAIVIIGVIAYWSKKEEEKKLRESNPEAWVRLKELEHDKERMKHENRQSAARIGGAIARIFFGK